MVDDSLQPQPGAVLRRIDFGDPIGFQLSDLLGDDHPTAAAKHLDMIRSAFPEQIHHVFKKFDVTALVAGDGNPLSVFLDSSGDNLPDRAVVAQMDHLHTGALKNSAHDIDGGIVAVEKGCGRHDPHGVLRPVYLNDIVHAFSSC